MNLVLYFRRLLPIELFKIRLIHKELPNLLFHSIKVTYILHINKRKVQQLQRFMIQLPFQSGRRRQSVDVSFSSFLAQREGAGVHPSMTATLFHQKISCAPASCGIFCRNSLPAARLCLDGCLRKKEKMCRGCAGDTGNYVHLCV